MNYRMDLKPNQIVRHLQLGMRESVLKSDAIWLCIACETCSTRCPREVDLAHVMDTLRNICYAQENHQNTMTFGTLVKDLGSRVRRGLLQVFKMGVNENVRTFNSVFLENVRRHGRSFEVSLIGGSNTGTGYLFRNLLKAPILLFKGKIHFIPEKMDKRRKDKLERIFDKVEKMEKMKI